MRSVAAIALVLGVSAAAHADDVVTPLRERVAAASTVIIGDAGRGYTAWDGSDVATIHTYTPFRVLEVLRGSLTETNILISQPGGEVGGVQSTGAVAAEFGDGERAVVLLGDRSPRDGSYDVAGRREGKYRVRRGAGGQDAIEVRLGVDAEAYSNREKAPGTLLEQVPLEVVRQLARGVPLEDLAAYRAGTKQSSATSPAAAHSEGTAAPTSGAADSRPTNVLRNFVVAAAGVLAAGCLFWFGWRCTR